MELDSFLMDIEAERKRRIQTQIATYRAVVTDLLPAKLVRFVSWKTEETADHGRFYTEYTMAGIPTWARNQVVVFRVNAYRSETDGSLVIQSPPRSFTVWGVERRCITVPSIVTALSFLPSIILDDDTEDIQTTLIGALEV